MILLIIVSSVIFLLIYFFISQKNIEKSEKKQREESELIKYSDTCQALIYDFNRSLDLDKPIMTNRELELRLREIISDPEEQKASIQNKLSELNFEAERKRKLRECRKVGYKYEKEIFEIFDIHKELQKDYIIEQIGMKFRTTPEASLEIFKIWDNHHLIRSRKLFEDTGFFQVGEILEHDLFSLDKTDMTRNKWLIANNKEPLDEFY